VSNIEALPRVFTLGFLVPHRNADSHVFFRCNLLRPIMLPDMQLDRERRHRQTFEFKSAPSFISLAFLDGLWARASVSVKFGQQGCLFHIWRPLRADCSVE
jgi:hypothetical protein